MQKEKKSIISSLLLITATAIWGFAFVAQSEAMKHIEPFTMNGLRSLLAAIFLIPVVMVSDTLKGKKITLFGTNEPERRKDLLLGGLLCGIFVTVASSIQQIGIQYTTVGKAGFLTTAYIVFVPVISLILGKKINRNGWVAVVVALVGMFLLCVQTFGSFSVNKGDVLMIISSLFFAIHILVIDKFVSHTDPIRMSCIQFFICAIVCLVCAFIFEQPNLSSIFDAWFAIFFAGVLSAGVGYTLQIVAQKNIPAHITPIIMSLESVFSLIAGVIVLNEKMSWQERIGCILIFIAIIVAQTDFKELKAKFNKTNADNKTAVLKADESNEKTEE